MGDRVNGVTILFNYCGRFISTDQETGEVDFVLETAKLDDVSEEPSLGDGSFSRYIKSLDLGGMVRYDYVPDFQSALYAPESLASLIKE